MTGICVYMGNTNCNSNDILVEVSIRIKKLSLLRECISAKEAGNTYMTRVCCTFSHASEKKDQLSKKKAGWLLTILFSTGGGDGKKYGWFGRKVQREENVVEGVCCLWGP
jgi:hypothetical protein